MQCQNKVSYVDWTEISWKILTIVVFLSDSSCQLTFYVLKKNIFRKMKRERNHQVKIFFSLSRKCHFCVFGKHFTLLNETSCSAAKWDIFMLYRLSIRTIFINTRSLHYYAMLCVWTETQACDRGYTPSQPWNSKPHSPSIFHCGERSLTGDNNKTEILSVFSYF